MEKNPTGFHPTNKEKIAYLLQKVSARPLPSDFNFISIPTVDIYGDKEPGEIFKDYENHFFSKLKKNPVNGNYIRFAASGVWQALEDGIINMIYDSEDREIGLWNMFEYRIPSNDEMERWILEEYRLTTRFKNCIKDDCTEYVFCTVTKITFESIVAEEAGHESVEVETFCNQILESDSSSSSSDVQPIDNNPPA
ncbi:hypothetical protein DH2020_014208 [Rehmannia glutinosa]|uniref:NAC domain-containing protein n=1 Tax=Rehmannia glutinosa TaxID=99300 RepID=A0ABR0WVR4_REHGL